ncbi:GD11786 [Drosophila simulans]|uniref:GD11786 n=1 Tax=Drosophila simulans TaxID=7240 RepID=B4NVC8_DROSI|nr:GD11786 [Drosophila simulans]
MAAGVERGKGKGEKAKKKEERERKGGGGGVRGRQADPVAHGPASGDGGPAHTSEKEDPRRLPTPRHGQEEVVPQPQHWPQSPPVETQRNPPTPPGRMAAGVERGKGKGEKAKKKEERERKGGGGGVRGRQADPVAHGPASGDGGPAHTSEKEDPRRLPTPRHGQEEVVPQPQHWPQSPPVETQRNPPTPPGRMAAGVERGKGKGEKAKKKEERERKGGGGGVRGRQADPVAHGPASGDGGPAHTSEKEDPRRLPTPRHGQEEVVPQPQHWPQSPPVETQRNPPTPPGRMAAGVERGKGKGEKAKKKE